MLPETRYSTRRSHGAPRGHPRPIRRSGAARQSGDRRADIIAAAIHVIARDGLRACTVSALAEETGFARGHFTYHFRTKEEIIGLAFATVASDWATMQIEAAAPDGTARTWLEHRVRAAVDWVRHRPDYFRCLMNFRVEMMRDPAAFPRAQQIRAQLWDLTAQKIRAGITEGTFHPPGDPAVEARLIFAMVDGMMMHAIMDPTFYPDESLADLAWQVVADRLGVKD